MGALWWKNAVAFVSNALRRSREGARAFLRYPFSRARRRKFLRNLEKSPPLRAPAPRAILDQITAQAAHDPAVLAPGPRAVQLLTQVEATDLFARSDVDAKKLFQAAKARPDTILVLPWLALGGADNYAADVIDALAAAGAGRSLTVLTQQTSVEAAGWERVPRLAPFCAEDLLFWRDFCGPSGAQNVIAFGRFLHALRPRRIIVINSLIGLEAISMFGAGLSQECKLYCFYFSLAPMISVEVYGARFPRRTHPHALSLTDNEPMAATLRRLHGSQPGPGVAVLPPRLPQVPNDVFVSRVAARKTRRVGSAPRWVWFSRVEFAKGTEILSALAELKRGHQFDLYGPLSGDLKTFGLDRPNIRHRGLLPDVMAADFGAYDGFVFTSLFEGMPHVALEMCQHAIPMIAADVGGLGDTFGEFSPACAAWTRQAGERSKFCFGDGSTPRHDPGRDLRLDDVRQRACAGAAFGRRARPHRIRYLRTWLTR